MDLSVSPREGSINVDVRRLPLMLREARTQLASETAASSIERGIRQHLKESVDHDTLATIVQRFLWARESIAQADVLRDAKTRATLDVIAACAAVKWSCRRVEQQRLNRAATAVQAALRYRFSSRAVQRCALVAALHVTSGPLRSLVAIMLGLHDKNETLATTATAASSALAQSVLQSRAMSPRDEQAGSSNRRLINEGDERMRSTPSLGTKAYSPHHADTSTVIGGDAERAYIRAVKDFETCPLLSPVRRREGSSHVRRRLDDIVRSRGGDLPPSPAHTRKKSGKKSKTADSTGNDVTMTTTQNSSGSTDRTADIRGLQMLLTYSRDVRLQQNKQQRAHSASRNRSHVLGDLRSEASPTEIVNLAEEVAHRVELPPKNTSSSPSRQSVADAFGRLMRGSRSNALIEDMTHHATTHTSIAFSPTTATVPSHAPRRTSDPRIV